MSVVYVFNLYGCGWHKYGYGNGRVLTETVVDVRPGNNVNGNAKGTTEKK